MERVDRIKMAVTAGLSVLSYLWGWFGWLVLAWVAAMVLDYLTGSAAALRAGEWSSAAARDGIWHKLGSIVAVLVAALLDLTLGHLLGQMPPGTVPIEYHGLLCPVVIVWYILTEAGSILENAGRLGAVYPAWLSRAVAALKRQVDEEEHGQDQ